MKVLIRCLEADFPEGATEETRARLERVAEQSSARLQSVLAILRDSRSASPDEKRSSECVLLANTLYEGQVVIREKAPDIRIAIVGATERLEQTLGKRKDAERAG